MLRQLLTPAAATSQHGALTAALSAPLLVARARTFLQRLPLGLPVLSTPALNATCARLPDGDPSALAALELEAPGGAKVDFPAGIEIEGLPPGAAVGVRVEAIL